MANAQLFDIVKVNYTGSLDDGTVFDTSEGREPLQFVVGEGLLLEPFEMAILGMASGENRAVKIPAEQAYGEHHPEMVVEFDRSQFPPEIEPKVGYSIEIKDDGGAVIPALITSVTAATVTLDANHPLAGKALNFNIQLVEIVGPRGY